MAKKESTLSKIKRATIIAIVMTGVYLNFLVIGPMTIAVVSWAVQITTGQNR